MRFRHLQVKDGLSQSCINFVMKDKKGFYWIGTQYGLNRYDGKNITSFYTTNTSGLSSNYIDFGLEDANGNLWFDTDNHINRYNSVTQKFSTIKIAETLVNNQSAIGTLFKDDEHNIYIIAGETLWQIPVKETQKENPHLVKINKPATGNDAWAFMAGNFLYAGYTKLPIIYKYKSKGDAITLVDSIMIKTTSSSFISSLPSCNLPLLLVDNKAFFLKNDLLTPVFKEATNNRDILSCSFYNNKYYVGTNNGLFVFSNIFKFENDYYHENENTLSLSDNKIYRISNTNDGLLWFGNTVAGVNIHDTKNNCFETIKAQQNKPYNALSCTLKNDSVLLAGSLYGLDEFHKKSSNWFFYKNYGLSNHKIISLQQTDNGLLIGTTKGLFNLNKGLVTEINLKYDNPYVFDLNKRSDGKILASTTSGFFILNSYKFKDTSQLILRYAPYYTFSSYENQKREIVLNTMQGTILLDSNCKEIKNYFKDITFQKPTDSYITKSITGNENNTWFASLGNGLYYLKNKQFIYYNQQNGLTHNSVNSLEKDLHRNIWASTNKGINCITPQGKIIPFINQLELENPEFTINGSSGLGNQLFFCSNSGLLTFNADSVLKTDRQSEILKLNLNTIIKNYTDTVSINSYVELQYLDKMLLFNFSVPSYRHFEDIVLTYKLDGFDTQWHSTDNGKDILFNGLPYGEYTLIVKAQLKNGNVATSTQKITIIVSPPFWRRAWFRAIILLLLLSLMGFVGWYISRIKFKKQLIQLEINQKIHKEKERISQDLHDNIGSHISTLITGLDKMHITKTIDNAERLSDYARNTLSELRETIWALNTNEIDLQLLKQKTEDLLFDLITTYDSVQIKSHFSFSANYVLNHKQILLFYRIMQEAIANALKHSGCDQLFISIVEVNKKITLIIKDNGQGFDINTRKKGHHGLDNMQSRAQQAQIDYTIISAQNNGTEITLILQII